MNLTVKEIIAKLPAMEVAGNPDRSVRRVVAAKAGVEAAAIVWISDKNAALMTEMKEVSVICSANVDRTQFRNDCTYLITQNPRQYFSLMVREFFYETEPVGISEKVDVHFSVKVGRNVSIRAGAVIEKDVVIGDDCIIDSNSVIKKGTVIGHRVKIGANTTVGGVGFGYEKDETGQFELIPHIGNVVIEDDVEIGNNTAIDRAVLGSTFIRRNAKVDNLVHIAHGVDIGENSLIIANAMVAGSTVVGKNVWVAPSASILNKLTVGDNALIGMGAVVVKEVAPSQTIVGNPGKDISTLKKS